MEIKGFIPVSLLDYPGKICSIIFLPHCNFHCPYCQNPDLIIAPEKIETIPIDEILSYLKEKKKWIDGVCLTGGEPCLHKDLPELIEKIKSLGLLIKLDTNGTNPKMLEQLLVKKLLDYIAMDIKAPKEKYELITKTKVNMNYIERSVQLIKNSGIDYEFRTTVLPALHSEQDIIEIGKWLVGSKKYFLQQFRAEKTLDLAFQNEKPFSKEEMLRLCEIAKPYFEKCEVRGI